MADIARHVGVSRLLVSIVLRGVEGASDETRQRVLQAATELGYRPDSMAQRLRSTRTRLLGVVFELRRPFEIEFVEHMFPVASGLGYHLLLGAQTSGRSQSAVADELLSYRCEGLVVVDPERHGDSLEALAAEVPIVEVGQRVTRGLVDFVGNDDAAGARQAVDHSSDSATGPSPSPMAARDPAPRAAVPATGPPCGVMV
jgi:DNA-binding LacI/PurR family transcriptional regulator